MCVCHDSTPLPYLLDDLRWWTLESGPPSPSTNPPSPTMSPSGLLRLLDRVRRRRIAKRGRVAGDRPGRGSGKEKQGERSGEAGRKVGRSREKTKGSLPGRYSEGRNGAERRLRRDRGARQEWRPESWAEKAGWH